VSGGRSARVADYVGHMVEAARRIANYTSGMTLEEFRANPLVQDGVIRNFEVIGEAARNIELADPPFVERHADIAWAAAQGMRHRLAHGYFRIDLDLVWRTVQRDVPELLEKLLALSPSLGR
jgi:uncharacterized protein with HEPN domain